MLGARRVVEIILTKTRDNTAAPWCPAELVVGSDQCVMSTTIYFLVVITVIYI
jgi:hypothetical protein